MNAKEKATLRATPEQVIYAGLLNKGMLIGFVVLCVTYAIYVLGIVTPYIPLEELPNVWKLGVQEYLQQMDIPTGWGWVGMINYADFLNFIGIALLAGVTIVCYLSIIPTLLKNNDKVYAAIAALEVLVLSLAASGVLTAGH